MKHLISFILSFLFLISLSSCKTTATAYKETSETELKEQAAATGTTAAEELATVIGSTSTNETENRNVVIEFEKTEYYESEPDTADGVKPEPTPNQRTADASKPPNVKSKTKGTITINDNKQKEGYHYDEAVMTRREFEQWQEDQRREIDEMLKATQEKKKKGNDYGLIVILFLIVAALVSLAVIIKKPR